MFIDYFLDLFDDFTEEDLYFLISWARFGIEKTHESHRKRCFNKYGEIIENLRKRGIKVYGWQFNDIGKDSDKIVFARDI